MSLYDQAKTDNQDILTRLDGLTLPMTVTNRNGQSLEVRGRYTDIGFYIDPATGMPVVGRSQAVAFTIADVASILEADGTCKGWKVSLTGPNGDTITGRMPEPMINRTLGYVQSHLVEKSS